MTHALCFNEVRFDVVDRDGTPWVRGPQIGDALGYHDGGKKIQELFSRHADEFTDSMTAVVEVSTAGGPQKSRIFSPRGCHLLAMFARTKIAKAFRKWVLDVLDARHAPESAPAELPISTTADRAPLRALCAEWARKMAAPGPATQDHHRATSLQLKANFQLDTIKQLPVAWIPDAIAFVQEKIDGLQTQTALPAPEPKQEQAMLPMPDSTEDVAMCMNKLRMAKGIIMEESDRLFRIIKKRVSTRTGNHGPAAHSMLVNMNYASEEIAYGLDRQLNALERIAQAGLLTSEALPVRM